jgi:hypothetical protein
VHLPKHPLLLAAGAACLLVAGAGLGVARAYVELYTLAPTQPDPELMSSVRAIPDLHTLVQSADLVIVGRVEGNGTTHLEQLEPQAPAHNPPPAPFNVSPQKAGLATPPPESSPAVQLPTLQTASGIPSTSFTIEIERVVRGDARVGERVTLVQNGGVITASTFPGGPLLRRTVELPGDPLLRAGERAVLFLTRSADGTYSVLGAGQGHLVVDSANLVHPVQPGAPAVQSLAGESVESVVARLNAAP